MLVTRSIQHWNQQTDAAAAAAAAAVNTTVFLYRHNLGPTNLSNKRRR